MVRCWLPIFDAGRTAAGVDAAAARRDIAIAQYDKAIQSAFKEVGRCAGGAPDLRRAGRGPVAQAQAEAARLSLSTLRYDTGAASQLDLLDAQRACSRSQQAHIQAQLRVSRRTSASAKVAGLEGQGQGVCEGERAGKRPIIPGTRAPDLARARLALPRPDPLEPPPGLVAAAVAHLDGAVAGGRWHVWLAPAHRLHAGTILMRSAGCAVINDVADRDFDRQCRAHGAAADHQRAHLGHMSRWPGAGCWRSSPFALVLTTNWPTIAMSFGALAVTIAHPFTAVFRCRRPCWAWPSALASRWPSRLVRQRAGCRGWIVLGNLACARLRHREHAMVDRNDDSRSACALGDHAGPLRRDRSDGLYAICGCWWQAGQAFAEAGVHALAAAGSGPGPGTSS